MDYEKRYLSRLAYECLKTSPNAGADFNYTQFKNGLYDTDHEMSDAIRMLPEYLNLAFARLCDGHKLRTYRSSCFFAKLYNGDGFVYVSRVDAITNVFKMEKGNRVNYGYERLGKMCEIVAFKSETTKECSGSYAVMSEDEGTELIESLQEEGYDTFYINKTASTKKSDAYTSADDVEFTWFEAVKTTTFTNSTMCIEGYKHLPHCDEYNIEGRSEDGTTGVDIALANYGVEQNMWNYIVEFVKAQMMEAIEPELANEHNARAENYFNDIPEDYSDGYQIRIKKTYHGRGRRKW